VARSEVGLQIVSLVVLEIVMIYMIIKVNPMEIKMENRLALLNEVLIYMNLLVYIIAS